MSGLFWLVVLITSGVLFEMTSHAYPLPKRVAAALEKASLNEAKSPNAASMADPRAPSGVPPPFGLMILQNRE